MLTIKNTFLLSLIICFSACEGNISMTSNNSTSSEKNIKVNSKTIVNGDTTISTSDSEEKDYREDKKNTDIKFNIKDKTGITDQIEKKIRKENGDTTAAKQDGSGKNPNTKTSSKLKKRIDCKEAIADDDFESYKEQVRKAFMDDDKLLKAKKIFNENCLTAKQARDLALVFMMDDGRLEMAKFAYGRTTDKDNFLTKFSKVFRFDDYYTALEEFVEEE